MNITNTNNWTGTREGAGFPRKVPPPTTTTTTTTQLWVTRSQQHLMWTLGVYDFKEVVNMLISWLRWSFLLIQELNLPQG